MQSPELIVVIPAYNEGARVVSLVTDWMAAFRRLKIDYVFRIYNDASTDDTALQLNMLAAANPDVEIIHETMNRGHGPVLYKAFSEAKNTAWVFQIDGDHELACHAFERLWNERHNYDLLLGARASAHKNVFRKLITRVAQLMVRMLFGKAVADVNCPYRLMRTSFLQQVLLHMRPGSFAPNVLLVALAQAGRFRIFVTPVSFTGLSKHQKRWQPPWRMLRGSILAAIDLLIIRWYQKK